MLESFIGCRLRERGRESPENLISDLELLDVEEIRYISWTAAAIAYTLSRLSSLCLIFSPSLSVSHLSSVISLSLLALTCGHQASLRNNAHNALIIKRFSSKYISQNDILKAFSYLILK